MSKQDSRTTAFVAIGTFVGLSLITLVAWSVTRPAPAPQAVVAAAAPVASAPAGGLETFERIAIDDFQTALRAGQITVIDVRSIDQYMASHIPGSLHIPVARIEGEIPYLPKGKPVVTYCTCPAEESSGEAAMILARGGVPARALQGGLDAWTQRGLPIQSGVQ